MAAYKEMIRKTSTEFAPWYVIPANHKHIAWVIASTAIVEADRGAQAEFSEDQRRGAEGFEKGRARATRRRRLMN